MSSWFSNITGKAENLLTRLDQSAASALHQDDGSDDTTYNTNLDYLPNHSGISQTFNSLTYSKSVPVNLGNLNSSLPTALLKPTAKSTKLSQASPRSVKKVDSDEALFAFLNSSEHGAARKHSRDLTQHSRQSSTSSVVSNKSEKAQTTSKQYPVSSADDMADDNKPLSEDSPDAREREDTDIGNKEAEDHASLHDKTDDSCIETENHLLRSEITSLNQEMSSLIQRAKDSQEEVTRLRQKLRSYNDSASQADQIVRELQARESDLMEALSAKDSQLAVLRVRLEEADRTLDQRQIIVEGLQSDRERILQDHTDVNGVHSHELDSLRAKLTECEGALRLEQEASRQLRQEMSQRQASLEAERKSLTDALTAGQRKLEDERSRYEQMNVQMRSCKSNLQVARQELEDYKDKASRILQSKERLIASLREGSGASGDSMNVSQLEYDAVKQERDMFKEDLNQFRVSVENYKSEIQDLEVLHQTDVDTSQDQVRSLEESISEERRKNEDLLQELDTRKREIQYGLEELQRQKNSMQQRIDEREREIDKLRIQLTTKTLSTVTENELEARVRSLTESLIQKQTTLEALSSEKNSLYLQLERLNSKYEDLQAMPARSSTVVNMNEDEELRQRIPGFLREKISDAEVTRRMKRAANMIDKFSIKLGVFLRRYPIARVFVIIYMFMLHAWVTLVLLTYKAEIHGADYQPKPPT